MKLNIQMISKLNLKGGMIFSGLLSFLGASKYLDF